MLGTMNSSMNFENAGPNFFKEGRSRSAQGLGSMISSSPSMKIPLPPRLWITDIEDESSEVSAGSDREDGAMSVERSRVRSRFRHYKQRTSVPIGIFWDIENCQVPRGCSAIDVVSAIRNKFLTGRREADFVVVCDVRKEAANRLQELNDAQISLIHVCGTQKNAADEKLRQCMRRFGELHTAPASLLLISGDINFAADLSDFRHRKNMEVILVHKQNTSSALIACASSHYSYNDLTANLPRNPKTSSQTEEDEEPTCELDVGNLPLDQPPKRVSRRLRHLADNCGGKVVRVNYTNAVLRFPTPDHASRALKRMDGEDVFGRKISTRYARGVLQPKYSSDEGYGTATTAPSTSTLQPRAPVFTPQHQMSGSPCEPMVPPPGIGMNNSVNDFMNNGAMDGSSMNSGIVNNTGMNNSFINNSGINNGLMNTSGMMTGIMNNRGMNNGIMNNSGMNNGIMSNNGINNGVMNNSNVGMNNSVLNNSGISNEESATSNKWAMALQQLPTPTPPPLDFCPPPAPRPRKIRGTHGSFSLDRSGCSSSNSGDERGAGVTSRAQSPWNCSGSFSEHSEDDGTVTDLTVTNLPPYEPVVLQEMLTELFGQYVGVVRVSVWAGTEGPIATVTLRSEWDARIAIARVHKRRLGSYWAGRRLELSLGRPSPAPNLDVLRARLRAILLDQKNHTLPLLRLRDAYASRHCCALTISDLAKVKDTVVIHDNFGRLVQLIDLTPVSTAEKQEAPWKCHLHACLNTDQEDGSRILQPVFMEVSVLAKCVQMLLENHGGILPLLSFVECYEATFPPLVVDTARGVALELLLRNIPGIEVKESPSRHITWRAESNEGADTPPGPSHLSESSRSSADRERDRPRTAPALEPMLALFERELIDLLRSAPRCCIPFSKLIPSFHHHFGRQCRVADYGFTKLPDLLAALGNTIVVLGSGSSRVITISAAAQARRWTSDLVKLLKAQPGRAVMPHDLPHLYQTMFGRAFSPADYGVCTLGELLSLTAPQCVQAAADGSLALPRRTPTPDERKRTLDFASQAVELLCHTPNLRMEFSRFVPAYHAHFGRQLRVAHYGCVKLVELFELLPDLVVVGTEPNGERCVRLATRTAKAVMSQRLQSICPVPLSALPAAYAMAFGAAPLPSALEVGSVEELVYASGACVEEGQVQGPAQSPRWAADQLAAAAVLAADRSVARGSTQEYFVSSFRRLRGTEPSLRALELAGVIEINVSAQRLQLTSAWRAIWRLAGILHESAPMSVADLLAEYTRRYGPDLSAEMGAQGVCELLRSAMGVFVEEGAGWEVRARVLPPLPAALSAPPAEDYSVHDTPPGQKGSRVFDSPKVALWSSPPASALPPPTALLHQEHKRRIRLAAHFDS